MGDRIKTNLDADLHQEVLNRHQQTGKHKSEIVNEMVREGYEAETKSFTETFYISLGGSTLVAGSVIGLLGPVALAVGMVLFGVLFMLWGSMQEKMKGADVTRTDALKSTLGL